MINLNPNRFISETPIIKNVNNGILSSRRAMPLKGITSDNDYSFAKGRMIFTRTHQNKPTTENGILQESKNKLIGVANRDASQVSHNRRVNHIANGTLNAFQKKMAFTNGNEVNTVRTTLHKTKSSGSRVPAKVFYKYSGAPTFYN